MLENSFLAGLEVSKDASEVSDTGLIPILATILKRYSTFLVLCKIYKNMDL